MKEIQLAFVLVILLSSCKEKQPSSENISEFYYDIICSPEAMPEYDGTIVSILDDNQNPIRDTLIDQIEKRRDVFKPCRHLIFMVL